MMKKNDELELSISGLNSEGDGIAKTEDGFVVFVPKSLPGDKVRARIIKKKSNFANAMLLEIISPSADRTEPKCAYFGKCGGCKFQNYKYEKQLEYKRQLVRDSFERIGGFTDLDVPDVLGCDDIFYYRNKMEFSFSIFKWHDEVPFEIEENPFSLGLHVPGFFEKIIDVDDCKLQSELSDEILNFSRNFFREKNLSVYNTKSHSGYLRFLIIRQSRNTNHLMVNLITYDSNEPLMEEYASEMKKLFPQVTTLVNSFSTKKAMVAVSESSTALYGDGYIIEKLNNGKREISFKISPNSFFQTNTRQTEKLYKVMMDFADFSADDSVYDLYCGAGAISLFISDFVKSVTGVELVGDAIENAKENAVLNNIINVKFVLNDIKDYLKSISGSIESGHNKLILDPPRSGLHPDICKMLSETNFEKILYISCNPVTQARDIKMICEKGKYRIEKMKPVDMFPQTSHVENVCCLIPGENLKKIN